MGISNFDGQGILAPEKTEIEAEVVGSITMKEQLWRIKQQREALKARYYFRAHMPLPIVHHACAFASGDAALMLPLAGLEACWKKSCCSLLP